ncbi:MAG: DUF296 domain-containing protein, partial [Phyllobacterium sp.]
YGNGTVVDDIATEVFVTRAVVAADAVSTEVEIVMVDTKGGITSGTLKRGDNPVCITFELCLESCA